MDKEFFPYEEALALRELGFNEQCFAFYIETKERQPASYSREGTFYPRNSDLLSGWHSAPTYSQAFRWFRDTHKIDVHIMKNDDFFIAKGGKKYIFFLNDFGGGDTHEEAELECLRKLIQIAKGKAA
jgi:hypothetical protein